MPELADLDVVPLLLAVLLGGAIGLEREWNGRPAGLRTHVIVCVSSTMLIMVSRLVDPGSYLVGEPARLVFDPNRMAAGIVTGIGFLGAATVIRSGDLLRGLTTAACIWFVAGLGIVLGNQHYALGGAATAIVLVSLTLFHRLTDLMSPVLYRRLIVIGDRRDIDAMMGEIRALLKGEGLHVLDVSSGLDNREEQCELVFSVSLRNEYQMPRVNERVAAVPGVISARWKLINVPH